MLHLRLSVDAKCPRHPNRTYQEPPPGCSICQCLWQASEYRRRIERELKSAQRFGADLRWRNFRRRAVHESFPPLVEEQAGASRLQGSLGFEVPRGRPVGL
jgi:hypothetical protein